MNLRKITTLLLAIILTVCTLTACKDSTPLQQPQSTSLSDLSTDNVTDISKPSNIEANVSINKKPVLTEVTTTGPIGYDLFSSPSGPKYHFNKDLDPIFRFYHNNKYGYSDENGNVVIDSIYDQAGVFCEGKAVVLKGDVIEIIDTTGKTLYSCPKYGHETYAGDSTYIFDDYFDNGILLINDSSELIYKILDSDMNELDPNSFPDKAIICSHYTVDVIDYAGNKLISFPEAEWGTKYYAENGYANVMNTDRKWGLFELSTKTMKIDYKYDYVGMYSDGLIPVCSYSKYGAIDIDGNEVIPCNTYTYIGPFSCGRAIATKGDNLLYIIDKEGNEISKINGINLYDENYSYEPFSEKTQITCVRVDGYNYIVSTEGENLYCYKDSSTLTISDNYFFDSEDNRLFKVNLI